jgi:subtilase family protein
MAPLALVALVGLAATATPELHLAGGTFRPFAASSPAPEVAAPGGSHYLVLMTREPLSADERRMVEASGAEILDVIPPRGYRVRLPPDAAGILRRLPFVLWLGALPGQLKVDPQIAREAAAPAGPVRLHVVVAPGEPERRVLEVLAGATPTASASGKDGAWRVIATVPASRIATVLSGLAALPEVEAIEPARTFRLMNQDAVWVHQSFVSPQQAPVFARGVFGCGQIVAVADSAQDHDSCYFRDTIAGAPPVVSCGVAPCPPGVPAPSRRKDILYYNWSGTPTGEEDTCPTAGAGSSGHGTHTSGSVAGDAPPYADCAGFTDANRNGGDGQAPGAKLVIQELGDGLEYLNERAGTFWNLTDVAFANGARIHSNSWGGACYNAFGECIPGCTAPYDSYSRDADLAMWSHPDLLVVVGAGNAGELCPPPVAIGTPAIAKSPLVVGSVGHGPLATNASTFTSPGPLEDGRLSPTVAAQGEATVSAASDATIGSNNCASCSLDGTSMSAPTAAGLAALVREYYAAGFYATGARTPAQGFSPTGALVKATLVDAAQPLAFPAGAPSFVSGYGRIQLDQTLTFTGSTFQLRVDDRREGLATGSVVEHAYDVAAGTPLRATLVWTDFPAALNAAATRVNELKLEVVDPAGQVWFQTLDGATGLPKATALASDPHDTLNVVEKIVFTSPAAGRYIVRVRGIDVPWGPQPFALVVRGALADCPAPPAPSAPALTTPADHQVRVTWSPVPGATTYDVYRTFGSCPGSAWVPVASAVTGTTFLDTGVSGGAAYSYHVTAASDAAAACESPRSPCASVVPTGSCGLAPQFAGLSSAASSGQASCAVNLSWGAASPFCQGDVRYNVYRGTTSGFTPSPANRIAQCLTGTSFVDAVGLPSGAPRWYVVRAEDAATGHGGPCRGGNEEGNLVRQQAAAFGPPVPGTWTDDAGDTGAAKLAGASPWTTAATGGNALPSVYTAASFAGACADLGTPTLTLAGPGAGPQLTFSTRHDLDYDPFGEIFGREGSLGQVEVATGPGFSTWTRVPLTPTYPNFVDFPFNECTSTQAVTTYFTGIRPTYTTYTGSLVNWAGGDVKLRFHLSGDYIYSEGNWWLDDLAVSQAFVPGACTTAAAGPPPIPDGGSVPGQPMRASRSGGSVLVTWDAASCPASAVNIYYGALGSFASFTGASCGLPASGSATVALPGSVWFLVVATDSATTDGSHARRLDGTERTYAGAGSVCPAITSHVTSNGCP